MRCLNFVREELSEELFCLCGASTGLIRVLACFGVIEAALPSSSVTIPRMAHREYLPGIGDGAAHALLIIFRQRDDGGAGNPLTGLSVYEPCFQSNMPNSQFHRSRAGELCESDAVSRKKAAAGFHD